jgi:hypothetical protein
MLQGPYCSRCGQKAAPLNPTAHELLHDVVHEFAHVDSRIVRSVWLLLARPGFLTREYFAGRRVAFVSPIRLYLIFSVLYFALVAIAPPESLRVTCTTCPPELRAAVEAQMRDAITHWIPRTMFVLVPLFGVLVALAARRSPRNYPLHLYFALHVHAAWFAALSVVLLAQMTRISALGAIVGAALILYGAVYPVVAFRAAYGVRTGAASWRMGLVLTSYAVAVLLAVIAVLAGVVLPTVRSLANGPPGAGL